MITGNTLVTLNNKQSLGLAELWTNFFQYLESANAEVVQGLWSDDGWFVTSPALTSAANDTFDIEAGKKGTDGIGGLIQTGDAKSYDTAVPFENAVAAVYHVGLMSCRPATTVKASPETGLAQYTAREQIVGVIGTPDAVVDNGTNVTLDLTTVTDVVTQAGRTCRVYLASPETSVQAEAFETVAVTWNGTNNEITTTGVFGQTVVSTTAADYVVVLEGPKVIKTTDISGDAGVLYVGTVTGTGSPSIPTVFVITGATLLVSIPDLNDITDYDPGSGRLKIAVDAFAGDTLDPITAKDTSGNIRYSVSPAGQIDIYTSGGSILLEAAGSGLDGIIHAKSGDLLLRDANMAATEPLGSATAGGLSASFSGGSLLDAINEAQGGQHSGPTIIEGMVATDGGGLDLDVSSGEFRLDGNLHALTADTITLANSSTEYVYADVTSGVVSLAKTSTYSHSLSRVWIAKTVTSGGAITSIVPIASRRYWSDRRDHIVYVGASAAPAMAPSDFQTIAEAMAAIEVWTQDPSGGDPEKAWTVRVLGECVETETPIAIPVDGITIEGAAFGDIAGETGPMIRWVGGTDLFDLNGKERVTFRNLSTKATIADPTTPSGTTPSVNFLGTTAIADVNDLVVVGCRHSGGTGFIFLPDTSPDTVGSVAGVLVRDCVVTNVVNCGVVLGQGTGGTLSQVLIADSVFKRKSSGSSATTFQMGISIGYASGLVIRNCAVGGYDGSSYGFDDDGINVTGVGISITGCTVVDNAGVGIEVGQTYATDYRAIITGNRVLGPSTRHTTGIWCFQDMSIISDNVVEKTSGDGIKAVEGCTVSGNSVADSTGGSNSLIDVEAGCTVSGNRLVTGSGRGIYTLGEGAVTGNVLTAVTGYTIEVAGPRAIVSGNQILADSSPNDYLILVSAEYCVLKGNVLEEGGIYFDNDANYCVASENMLYAPGTTHGIYYIANFGTITGNFVNKATGNGIYADTATDMVINGNHIAGGDLTIGTTNVRHMVTGNKTGGGTITAPGASDVIANNQTA